MVTAPRGAVARVSAARTWVAIGLGLWPLWVSALGSGPASAQAASIPGPYAQPQTPPWQFRPAPPSNARGAPPAYPSTAQPPVTGPSGGYQTVWPGAYAPGVTPTPNAPRPTRLEWSIDDTEPLVQQNLLLRLQLISSETLTTADPELAGGNEVLVEAVGSPTASARTTGDGRRELVTRFSLILTPLRPGDLELPRFKVTGTRPGRFGAVERYEAVAVSPLRLRVRPAMAAVTPWLPLRSLTISAIVDHPELVEPGRPVTLTLAVAAEGALAAQLPDLEGQLVSPAFRIYRERTLTDNRLSQDGRQLTAKRTEIYTLVPLGSGTLRLPEIKVPWWNLETSSRQVAILPIKTLKVEGAAGPFGLPTSWSDLGSGWSKLWLPISAMLLVIAGYWVAVLLYRRGPDAAPAPPRRPRRERPPAPGAWRRRARRALQRLNPMPLATRARMTVIGFLPDSSRLLWCVRDANRASDPGAWCERFEQSARCLLRAPGQRRTPNLTERILDLRPRADRARVTHLMAQLDAALYGRQALDFPRWKRDFKHQVGHLPGLFRPRRPETRFRRATLPTLNPRAESAPTLG